MPAPDFDLAIYGSTGNRTTTTEALDAAMQSVLSAVWTQMHALAARGVVDTSAPGGTGNAITAQIPATHTDATFGVGSLFSFEAPATNTGAVTLSLGQGNPTIVYETAKPLYDEDGSALTAGMLVNGRRYIVRKAGSGGTQYRLFNSGKTLTALLWQQAARGDLIGTGGEAGTANEVTAVTAAEVSPNITKVTGTKFLVRFPRTNTGPMTLSIDGETPAVLLNADNLPMTPGEIIARRRYIVRYSTSGPQYNLCTDYTRQELLDMIEEYGGGSGGGTVDAEPRAEVMGWLDGSIIRGVGDADGDVANIGSLTIRSPVNGGRFVGVVANKPGIGANTLLGGYPGFGLLAPAAPKVLHVWIGLGQSLMVGAEAATSRVTLSQPWPDDALMFAGASIMDVRLGVATQLVGGALPLDPDTLTGFQTHIAKVGVGSGDRGETPMEGFAKRLTTLARQMGIQYRMLSFTAAMGASSYNDIKKGTQIYANMLLALTKAKALAEARGWRIMVDGFIVKHGESDGAGSGYAGHVAEWYADANTDVKAITGQTADTHFFFHMPSSAWSGKDAMQGMVAAQTSNIHIAGSDYAFLDAYSPDFSHMLGPGYHLGGEMLAMAVRDTLWKPTPTKTCVQMTAASRSGTAVTLTYDVPVGPLAIDTTNMSDPGQKGFQFFAGSTEIAITNVAVTDNGTSDNVGTIVLTLASAPVSGAERVEYAQKLQSDPRTLANVLRGNVRDSAPETSQYDGRRLYRWGISQRINL